MKAKCLECSGVLYPLFPFLHSIFKNIMITLTFVHPCLGVVPITPELSLCSLCSNLRTLQQEWVVPTIINLTPLVINQRKGNTHCTLLSSALTVYSMDWILFCRWMWNAYCLLISYWYVNQAKEWKNIKLSNLPCEWTAWSFRNSRTKVVVVQMLVNWICFEIMIKVYEWEIEFMGSIVLPSPALYVWKEY